jgi:aspartate/methionine/tyrosine aminotransferase
MKTHKSGATLSSIVGIGQDIRKLSAQNGMEYLYLNRGINNVVKIDLNSVIPQIDFNTEDMQFYTPTTGRLQLKNAVNKEYFNNESSSDNIFVTVGGMHALSMIFSILDVKKFYAYKYFWGSYSKILTIEKRSLDYYDSYNELLKDSAKFKNTAVIICDPNNPTGEKFPDELLLEIVEKLNQHNAVVIWDSPYRRLFYENTDTIYRNLLKYSNVIICESFSKSVGLSGQRVGFIHSINTGFNAELAIRLLYSVNGVNAFSQILIEQLLTSETGKQAVNNYRQKTIEDISKNISFLKKINLLPEVLYGDKFPLGIFCVVSKTFDQLLEKRIGSVPMSFFTKTDFSEIRNYARICVSVPNEKFEEYFREV